MSLRSRLLVSLGLIVTAAMLVGGTLVVGFTRANLVAQLDTELLDAIPQRGGRPPSPTDTEDPTGRRIAYLLVDLDGDVLDAIPSGYALRPDPLPSMPVEEGRLVGRLGEVIERPAVDGSLSYRVVLVQGVSGTVLALAAPLTAVDGPIAALVRNLLIVLGVAILAIVAVGWIMIRQSLRPLERIASTADAIATGDLTRRADLPQDRSEVGRLGTAFDSMLDQIQAAFEEEREARQAREASEARLRQFIGDASHELRTPLTTVRGYTDLYAAGALVQAAELDRAMARIGTESRRMQSLVEDLLLLARLDQGRPLRRDRVDLSGIAEDAVRDLRAIEPDRPVSAVVHPGILVTGDEDRLRQVIGNLLTNVRVHTPPPTPVEVFLAVHGDRAELAVVDHGPGIPPGHAERIFDRFYRADPGRSRDRGGSGLGLSIASSVVGAHGGDVRHHPTDGGGATFTVSLPLAARPPAAGPHHAGAREPRPSEAPSPASVIGLPNAS